MNEIKTDEKNPNKELADALFYKRRSVYENITGEKLADIEAFAGDYLGFIGTAKTERETVESAVAMLGESGFVPYSFGDKIECGGRYYYNNRGKSLYAFSVGTEPITEGIRINASHGDSPRVDFKPNPLYEDGGMAYFKTHYYGGIKKYQWTAIPLAIHGVVVKKDGESVKINIGEEPGDPVFCINDLLPHLGAEQAEKPLGKAIAGETLNILAGSRPVSGEGENKIKLAVMKILGDKYGLTEEDFRSAELCAVPAFGAREIGLDRSMIGAYGHDDRVCAYPALRAMAGIPAGHTHTLMCVVADKEETGSEGNTGMKCSLLADLIGEIAVSLGGTPAAVRAKSKCLSADVSAAFDPNFGEVYEKNNSAYINCGVVMNKYTGSRGKSGTSDASAEFVGWVRGALASDGVVWQLAELGKVDCGGGGTVAMYIANLNIDTVDLGVPVLSMHSPYEVIAKADLYETFRAFKQFYLY